MIIKIIAAMAENRVIGKDGEIPWSVHEEQKHFKEETIDSPVIMGRTTFDSILREIGCPLPDRHNIVLSTSRAGLTHPNVSFVQDIDNALNVASQKDDEVYIAGGESVYEQFIGMADEMILSIIDEDVDGDSYFPQFDDGNWKITERQMNNNFSVIRHERI